ncbi:unnamed protein product, partial [Allacma fusca]
DLIIIAGLLPSLTSVLTSVFQSIHLHINSINNGRRGVQTLWRGDAYFHHGVFGGDPQQVKSSITCII